MIPKFYIFTLLSIGTSVTCLTFSPTAAAPVARAIAPRSVPTSWSLPHRVSLGTHPNRRASDLVERQINQIPFQWCPEFFNNPPKLCSDCGGDTLVKGTCDRILLSGQQFSCQLQSPFTGCSGYFCKCSDDGGPDNSPQVTSTTVIDGQTGTAVWEPITFTEYAGLKASTTVTLTESATVTGSSELETVVAVVFAGGVAWWLASQSGAAGAALALQPPAASPEGSREDDNSCDSNPKDKCSDCGGADAVGLCKSGTKIGCPCDEDQQECPADGPPKCSSTDCGGDDGNSKCKANGKLQGCQCCPDDAPTCSIDDCKGDDKNTCQAPKLKGCACQVPEDNGDVEIDPDDLVPPSDADQSSAAADVFTRIWGADLNNVPGYSIPAPAPTTTAVFCQYGAAPNQPRVPSEYCQCGDNYATFYSVVSGTNPCPFNPTSTGQLVTFSTPTPSPPPTPNPPAPTPMTTSTATPNPPAPTPTPAGPCNYAWCGSPFCYPECGPAT